jgi:hypothetical protein
MVWIECDLLFLVRFLHRRRNLLNLFSYARFFGGKFRCVSGIEWDFDAFFVGMAALMEGFLGEVEVDGVVWVALSGMKDFQGCIQASTESLGFLQASPEFPELLQASLESLKLLQASPESLGFPQASPEFQLDFKLSPTS